MIGKSSGRILLYLIIDLKFEMLLRIVALHESFFCKTQPLLQRYISLY